MRVIFEGYLTEVSTIVDETNPVTSTSELLKLATDGVVRLSLDPVDFYLYITIPDIHNKLNPHSTDWKETLKIAVSGIDTSLRMCDIPTLELCHNIIYMVLDAYCRPMDFEDDYNQAGSEVFVEELLMCKDSDYFLPLYFVLVQTMLKFPRNSYILRDVVTHLPVRVILSCFTPKYLNGAALSPLQSEGAYFALGRDSPWFKDGVIYGWDREELIRDTLKNESTMDNGNYADQIRIKYFEGAENMTPQDMCDFVVHHKMYPYTRFTRSRRCFDTVGEKSDVEWFLEMATLDEDTFCTELRTRYHNIYKLYFTTDYMPHLVEFLTKEDTMFGFGTMMKWKMMVFIDETFPGAISQSLKDVYRHAFHETDTLVLNEQHLVDLDLMCNEILRQMRAMFDSFEQPGISQKFYFQPSI